MITLQRTFQYLGDFNDAPFLTIDLSILFPIFDYVRLEVGEAAYLEVVRKIVSSDPQEIHLALSSPSYRASLPSTDLTGAGGQSIANFLIYTTRAIRAERLADLSFAIPIRIKAEGSAQGAPLGGEILRAIYLVRDVSRLFDALGMLARGKVEPDPERAAAFLENAIFLLNKDVYTEILPKFQRLANQAGDWSLLALIQILVDNLALDPTQPFVLDDPLRQRLATALTEVQIENQDQVIEFIEHNFARLFDFPILLPAIRILEVAGTFEVQNLDNTPLTKDELGFYDLALEYTLQEAAGQPVAKSVHFDWSQNPNPLTDNQIAFSFSDEQPILANLVSGPITVRVKSFDGATLWSRDYLADDPVLREVHIVVARVRPVTLTSDGTMALATSGKRLRGQVLELTKRCSLKDLTVVIQAKQDRDNLWRVVGAATTDASGSFSLAYPYGPYTQAQAIVSLTPNSPVEITIRQVEGRPNETLSEDFLYLLVTNPECDDRQPGDCGCDDDALHKASRLPDQNALITSDEYTQDIGGACINLSTPNRTLSEYRYTAIVRTSDPDVANYVLSKNEDGSFDLKGGQKKIQRAPVDLDNPICWQDAPDFHNTQLSVYQAVTVATGHVLHYRSEFRADGYSLGELLYSLALAPGQKKQIVVIDSAHTLLGSETQAINQGESLSASLVNERAITDQLGGNINEAMRGSSSASTSGISAGLGVGVNFGFIGAALGVAGGTSSSSASASQNSSRDTSMFFGEKLRQAIMQNAQSYRQLNATVVTSVREGQQYSVTTDVVANHNHCHALTMMYFEVLRHFAIFQELANVEECIFVPFLMTNFSAENIYKWSDVLASRLLPLPSNTYLQPFPFLRYRASHPLKPAFDAIRRRQTDYKFVDFPKGAYSEEPITSVTGYLTVRIDLPRPKSVYDRILSFPVVKREEIRNTNPGGILGHIVDRLIGENNVTTKWEEKVKFANDHIIIYDNFQQAPPAEVIEVVNFNNFFDKGSKDERLWTDIAKLCGYDDIRAFLENYFAHKTISQWTQVYNEEIAPRIVEAMLDGTISIAPFANIDLTPTAKYHGGSYLMRLNLRTSISFARNHPDLQSIRLKYSLTLANSVDFWAWATFSIEHLNINYTTRHYEGTIINRYLGEDLKDEDGVKNNPIATPMNSDEQRNPRTEDAYLERMLIEHLNSNLEYYNKVLWLNLDPDRRFMLLDGFNIDIYNDFGVPAGKRSLASVVKNELLTIAGNSLVFPVAAGYKVSRSYIAEQNQDGQIENVSLFEHYKPYTPIPPYRISVPSRGVFAEAVQGQCDACEQVKPNSSQDWTKFPTDEPTGIQPVITPVPTITDWKAVFKEFAQPLINIQNAPGLPEPGAGLSGLTELLGKAGIFKDITGLDATQQNVLRTYLSNQENARAFAEMAKNMVMQDHNTQNSDRIMSSLKSARDEGAISQDDYSKMAKDHLQKQIDGGEAQNSQQEQESKQKETSAIKSAVDLAQSGNRDVSASESDSEGNTKTLEVKTKGGASGEPAYDFSLPGTITPIKQPTPNACWAAVTTMMSNWKKHQSQSVDDYVKSIGAEYVQYITTGISLDKLADFCNAAGFKMASANTEYPVSFYYDVLQKNGPIWVIDLENADPKRLHGRLLVGIRGDGASPSTRFTLIDPATGSKYEEDLPTFVAKTEAVVKTLETLPDAEVPLLVYFKDAYDKAAFSGSGGSAAFIGTASNQDRVRAFVPQNENTLIVNGAEGPAVLNLKNWRGMYKNADGSFSQTKMDADRSFDDPLHPGQRKYSGGGYRAAAGLNKIVLHETAGFGNYNTISQFNVLQYTRPDGTKSAYKAMPHFCINLDGTIVQFLDVCELAEHGESLSSSSIGIEFVNHPWGADGSSQDGGVKGGITPLEIPAITGLPSLNNKHQKTELYIPSSAQLESLVTLLNALFAHPDLSALRQTWMNVININPAKFTTEKLDDLKAYFIINNAKAYLNNAKYAAINGNESSGGWSLSTPGVFNHSLFGGHTDGMIQSFYTWLRISQKMSAADAMTTFKAFIASKDSRVNAGSSVALVDVSKIVFAEV